MNSKVEEFKGKTEDEARYNMFEKIGNSNYEIINKKVEREKWWRFWDKNVTLKVLVEMQNNSNFGTQMVTKRKEDLIKMLRDEEEEIETTKNQDKILIEQKQNVVVQESTNTVNKTTIEEKTNSKEKNDIDELKNMILDLKSQIQKKENEALPLALERTKKILLEREIEEKLVKEFVQAALQEVDLTDEIGEETFEKEINEKIKRMIEDKIKIHTPISVINTKVIALVGPTGVGKTTTIAKIGWELYKAKRTVGFITTDVFRSGAKEQLEKFAKKMDFELKVAINAKQLKDALNYFQKVNQVDHILIDTVGRNMLEEDSINLIKEYLSIASPNSTSLVLSATSKVQDIKEILTRFKEVEIKSLIFTKTDETLNLGSILNIFDFTELPILYLTDGQDITKNIYSPTKEVLFERIYHNKKIELGTRKVLA